MSAGDWLTLAKQFGPVTVLVVLILITGYRKVWVWGYQLKDCEARSQRDLEDSEARGQKAVDRSDRWERMALKGTALADSSTEIGHKAIELAKDILGEGS